MFGEIFIIRRQGETLSAFRDAVCAALGIGVGQKRESEHRPNGLYYRTEAMGIRIQMAEADDSEFPNYDWWMTFRPRQGGSVASTMEGVGDLVAKELVAVGYSVLRVSPNPHGPKARRIRRRCLIVAPGSPPDFLDE